MEDSTTSREKILKKVRKALIYKTTHEIPDVDFESEIYAVNAESLEILFAKQLTELNGKFIFCENENEFALNLSSLIAEHKWSEVFCYEPKVNIILQNNNIKFSGQNHDIKNMDAGITLCELLVARTGSVIISSKMSSGRKMNVFPNYHIVLAYTSQLVLTHKDALIGIKNKYGANIPSLISSITGPSRTADIEKTLVQGAHGPKELFVLLVDDSLSSEN